jgi:hypothetical protein
MSHHTTFPSLQLTHNSTQAHISQYTAAVTATVTATQLLVRATSHSSSASSSSSGLWCECVRVFVLAQLVKA